MKLGPNFTSRGFFWKSRQGDVLAPKDFEDDHLVNTAALCQRWSQHRHYCEIVDVYDGPCYGCDYEAEELPWYEGALAVLSEEIARRVSRGAL